MQNHPGLRVEQCALEEAPNATCQANYVIVHLFNVGCLALCKSTRRVSDASRCSSDLVMDKINFRAGGRERAHKRNNPMTANLEMQETHKWNKVANVQRFCCRVNTCVYRLRSCPKGIIKCIASNIRKLLRMLLS